MTIGEVLAKTVESLTKVNERQSRQLVNQSNQIAELTAEVKKMATQIAWFQRQMFGRKSEKRLPPDNQPSLFDAAGVDMDGPQPEMAEATEEAPVTYTRKKSQKGVSKPRETWENLPLLETRVIEPQDVDLTCYRCIGEEVTTLVGFEPGKY